LWWSRTPFGFATSPKCKKRIWGKTGEWIFNRQIETSILNRQIDLRALKDMQIMGRRSMMGEESLAMINAEVEMRHGMALRIAETWLEMFRPCCERIEIAGSLRRGKSEVKDIEIVALPKLQTVSDLFGERLGELNALEDCVQGYRDEFELVKNGPKYKKLMLPEGIALDLFIVTPPAQWGVQFVIRTGPSEFSHWMVTKKLLGGALPDAYYVDHGSLWNAITREPIATPEEQDYFALCGLPWLEPAQRAPRWKR